MSKTVVKVDGNDGTGKTVQCRLLTERNPWIEVFDRSELTKLTDIFDSDLPEKLSEGIYFILDASVETCIERISHRGIKDVYDTPESLFKYRNRYRRLAIKYQTFYIDTTHMNIEQVYETIIGLLNGSIEKSKYTLPNPDCLEDRFDSFPLVAEGESKIIRNYDERFNVIKYKPTVYSHKQQRAGVIQFTDRERMEVTRYILYLFDIEGIPHSYVYVGHIFVLCEKLDPMKDIPPIEVIVKRCCVGTDRYAYYKLFERKTRMGTPVVNDNNEYPNLLVRFDYRNPNHHPETGKPMGDMAMGDDHANMFIDVKNAKELALRTFRTLMKHFEKMSIYFVDVCFMITNDGLTHYSEVSQDCGRYKHTKENEMTDLDKDVWRSGGSSELVYQKWHQLTEIVRDYVKKTYSNLRQN